MIRRTQVLHPKNGHTLRVIRVARISTLNQDERSLDDQIALLMGAVKNLFDGKVEYTDLATQGSGEKLDREELRQLEQMIESSEYDLVIAEDLARICRRNRAIDFCELCEDYETRLIAINDRVDTDDDGWRDGASISSWHHERSNRDTSERIKRSLRNRFVNGALLTDLGPFYDVPEGVTNIEGVRKKEGVEEIVEAGFQMLEQGCSYAEVADWLNDVEQFPVGGKCRSNPKWNGVLVRARFLNPRLKGVDEWNVRSNVRVNSTGRRRQVQSDASHVLSRSCPHLAFIDAARFDRLKAQLESHNNHYRRAPDANVYPLRGRPKKRTRFPGQLIYCGICGRKFVFGGHGRTDHLMCQGARSYSCWNGTTIDGRLTASKIATVVLDAYESLPEFDADFLRAVNEQAAQAGTERDGRLRSLHQSARDCERRIDNLIQFVAGGDTSARIREQLTQSERELASVRAEISRLEELRSDRIEIPKLGELKSIARTTLQSDVPYRWEFNKVMRLLTPKIVVFPHRLIDGGQIVHRARFRIQLGEILPDVQTRQVLRPSLERLVSVDLFEPPQREQFRKDVIRLRKQGLTEREVARQTGLTVTAAQQAARLQRMMDERGLTDPYEELNELPPDCTKQRRVLHRRYKFNPLPEAGHV